MNQSAIYKSDSDPKDQREKRPCPRRALKRKGGFRVWKLVDHDAASLIRCFHARL